MKGNEAGGCWETSKSVPQLSSSLLLHFVSPGTGGNHLWNSHNHYALTITALIGNKWIYWQEAEVNRLSADLATRPRKIVSLIWRIRHCTCFHVLFLLAEERRRKMRLLAKCQSIYPFPLVAGINLSFERVFFFQCPSIYPSFSILASLNKHLSQTKIFFNWGKVSSRVFSVVPKFS